LPNGMTASRSFNAIRQGPPLAVHLQSRICHSTHAAEGMGMGLQWQQINITLAQSVIQTFL
jgi:hypothetical protein